MTTTRAPYVTGYSPVAGATSTLSKSPQLFPENAPTHLWQALGSQVWTTDDRVLTDWISGLMAITLGHNHPEVTAAVVTHLGYGGPTWSFPHRLEEEVAATILRLTGFEDGQVRFFKTGSEACAAAVRIARAYTGRRTVFSLGYHGWSDACITTPPAWGVLPMEDRAISSVAWFNNFDAAQWEFHHPPKSGQAAALFLEPVTTEEPNPLYLKQMRNLCKQYGSLLLVDECITGGRYPEFTASSHYGVTPDLLILSKGLANGYPLAAVVGPRDIMRAFDVDFSPVYADGKASGPVYCSGTASGETSGLAAAAAALAIWERDQIAGKLWATGTPLLDRLRQSVERRGLTERVKIRGLPYRVLLDTDLRAKTNLWAHMIDAGQLCGTGWNVSAAHTLDDVAATCEAFDHALERIDVDRGRCVVAPYRQS